MSTHRERIQNQREHTIYDHVSRLRRVFIDCDVWYGHTLRVDQDAEGLWAVSMGTSALGSDGEPQCAPFPHLNRLHTLDMIRALQIALGIAQVIHTDPPASDPPVIVSPSARPPRS